MLVNDFGCFNFNVQPKKKRVVIDSNLFDCQPYSANSISSHKVKAKIRFTENCESCVNISEIEFTNMLSSPLNSKIINAFTLINTNENYIVNNCMEVRCNSNNQSRIEKIISPYVNGKESSIINYLRKSTIPSALINSDRGSFRVISYYQIEPKKDKRQKHSKHYVNILLFDPYHLFIPSKYDGYSAEDNRKRLYAKYNCHNKHFKDYNLLQI